MIFNLLGIFCLCFSALLEFTISAYFIYKNNIYIYIYILYTNMQIFYIYFIFLYIFTNILYIFIYLYIYTNIYKYFIYTKIYYIYVKVTMRDCLWVAPRRSEKKYYCGRLLGRGALKRAFPIGKYLDGPKERKNI